MENFIRMLLACTMTMSTISLLLYFSNYALGKRYNAKCFYYTWLIIIAGFIIPFRPVFEIPILQTNALDHINLASSIDKTIMDTSLKGDNLVTIYRILKSHTYPILFAIWICGFFFTILYHLIRHRRYINMIQRWSEDIAEEHTISLLNDLCYEMDISSKIDFRKCDFISGPMLICIFKPIILLPDKDLTDAELTMILKHELVHFKRKDLWAKALIVVAKAIHWFNPLLYLLSKEISLQCELSCDIEVIKNADHETRIRYCEIIVNMVCNQSRTYTALSTNFNGGKENMKKRLIGIMDTRKKKLSATLICAVSILTLGAGAAYASGNAIAEGTAEWKQETVTADATYSLVAETESASVDGTAEWKQETVTADATYSLVAETENASVDGTAEWKQETVTADATYSLVAETESTSVDGTAEWKQETVTTDAAYSLVAETEAY